MNETVRALEIGLARVSRPGGWHKGQNWRPGMFCVVTACAVNTTDDHSVNLAWRLLCKAANLGPKAIATVHLVRWNDRWWRTRKQVIQVYKRAIELAKDESK